MKPFKIARIIGAAVGGGGGGGGTYTYNPADKDASITLSNVDRTMTKTGVNGHALARAVQSLPLSGKFQWEVKQNAAMANDRQLAAIGKSTIPTNSSVGAHADGYIYDGINGNKYNNNVGAAYGSTYDVNDVIVCNFDADNLKLYFFKNGVPMNSANLVLGTGYAFIVAAGTYYPISGIYDVGGAVTIALLHAQQVYPLMYGYTDASGNVPAAVADPNFANNRALLVMNGSDGSTTFTDVLGHAFTASGTCEIDTDKTMFGGSSGRFAGGRIISGSTADFGVGNNDFTIEGWYNLNSGGGNQCMIDTRTASNDGFAIYSSHSSAPDCLTYIDNTGSIFLPGNTIFTANTWMPWRVTRSGTTVKGFLRGVQVFTGTDARTHAAATTLSIGDNYLGGSQPINGHLQDVRFAIGLARDGGIAYTPQKVAFATS